MHADTGAKHLKGKPKRKLRCSSLPFSSKIPEKRGKVVGREQKQKNKARICLHRLQEYRHSIKRPHHIAYIPTSCCVGADQLVEISDSDLEEMEDWVSTNMEVIVRSTPTHHTHECPLFVFRCLKGIQYLVVIEVHGSKSTSSMVESR